MIHIGVNQKNVWRRCRVRGHSIAAWFIRRTRRTRGDPAKAVVRQAGVKWSFEFERRSHGVRLFGDTVARRANECPSSLWGNLRPPCRTWSRRTSIKGFPIITDFGSWSFKKPGYVLPKGPRHLDRGDKSVKHFPFFFRRRKKNLFSWRGYILDPKSITIKFSFVKGKPKRSVLLTSRLVILSKIVNKINGWKKWGKRLYYARRRLCLVFPFFFLLLSYLISSGTRLFS